MSISYNWYQILFWRRYLFSLAFNQQLASVWELISQLYRLPSLNVSRDRGPDPHHSCPSGSLVLALLVFHHLPVYRGLVSSKPAYGAQLSDMLSVLPQGAVRHFLGWLQYQYLHCIHRVPCGWKSSGRGESCMCSPVSPTLFPYISFLLPPSPSHCQMCLSVRLI